MKKYNVAVDKNNGEMHCYEVLGVDRAKDLIIVSLAQSDTVAVVCTQLGINTRLTREQKYKLERDY